LIFSRIFLSPFGQGGRGALSRLGRGCKGNAGWGRGAGLAPPSRQKGWGRSTKDSKKNYLSWLRVRGKAFGGKKTPGPPPPPRGEWGADLGGAESFADSGLSFFQGGPFFGRGGLHKTGGGGGTPPPAPSDRRRDVTKARVGGRGAVREQKKRITPRPPGATPPKQIQPEGGGAGAEREGTPTRGISFSLPGDPPPSWEAPPKNRDGAPPPHRPNLFPTFGGGGERGDRAPGREQ